MHSIRNIHTPTGNNPPQQQQPKHTCVRQTHRAVQCSVMYTRATNTSAQQLSACCIQASHQHTSQPRRAVPVLSICIPGTVGFLFLYVPQNLFLLLVCFTANVAKFRFYPPSTGLLIPASFPNSVLVLITVLVNLWVSTTGYSNYKV